MMGNGEATDLTMLPSRTRGLFLPRLYCSNYGIDRHFSAFYSLRALGCSEGGQFR